MDKKKSPVSASTLARHDVKPQPSNASFTFINFNDNTALRIYQVLADLLCEQENIEPVKLSLKKKEA